MTQRPALPRSANGRNRPVSDRQAATDRRSRLLHFRLLGLTSGRLTDRYRHAPGGGIFDFRDNELSKLPPVIRLGVDNRLVAGE
jgi:hypothetical protein